jgi:chromosome segregation ATPase
VTDENEPATKGDLRAVEKRLDAKIDRVDEKVDRVNEKVDRVNEKVDRVNDKVDRVGALVENLEGRVRVLAEGHEALSAKVDALSEKFDGMERRVISELSTVIRQSSNARQIDELTGRVTALERDVNELKSRPTPPLAPTRTPKAAAKRGGASSSRKRSAR